MVSKSLKQSPIKTLSVLLLLTTASVAWTTASAQEVVSDELRDLRKALNSDTVIIIEPNENDEFKYDHNTSVTKAKLEQQHEERKSFKSSVVRTTIKTNGIKSIAIC